jgi:predicted RNase H-like HicB family nuclease
MIFNVTVDRDEDGVWILECPSIPGRVSQGKTKKRSVGERQGCHQALP